MVFKRGIQEYGFCKCIVSCWKLTNMYILAINISWFLKIGNCIIFPSIMSVLEIETKFSGDQNVLYESLIVVWFSSVLHKNSNVSRKYLINLGKCDSNKSVSEETKFFEMSFLIIQTLKPSWSTKESEMQHLDAVSKTTEWSLFVSKANHSISW